MIRTATARDIPEILAQAAKFFASGRFVGAYDAEYFAAQLEGMVEGDGFLVLIGEKGSAAFAVCPVFYSGALMANELWLFSEKPGEGRALLAEAERRAAEMGAHFVGVTAQVHKKGQTVVKLYERRGYTGLELSLAKEVA